MKALDSGPRVNPDSARLLLSERKAWRRMRFGDFADSINERVEPADAADEPYVGLEDLDRGNLHIRRWGKGSDVIGTKLRFRKGDVIFDRRWRASLSSTRRSSSRPLGRAVSSSGGPTAQTWERCR